MRMIRKWLLPVLAGLVTAAIASQAALMATPYVLMARAMEKMGARAPANSFGFAAPSTADNQPIVRPSPDLSYSTCAFDLSKGPVLVDVEPVPGHYWSVSVFDARTDVVAVRSDRETGGKPVKLALKRFSQSVPREYEPVQLDYNKGLVLIRILVPATEDYPQIDAIRRKARCRVAETK